MPLLRQHEAQARKGSRPCERALPGLRGINGKQAQRHGRREGMEQKDGTTVSRTKRRIYCDTCKQFVSVMPHFNEAIGQDIAECPKCKKPMFVCDELEERR